MELEKDVSCLLSYSALTSLRQSLSLNWAWVYGQSAPVILFSPPLTCVAMLGFCLTGLLFVYIASEDLILCPRALAASPGTH